MLIFGTTPLVAAAEPLPGFEASYTVRYGPLKGTMMLRLSRYGNGYTYETWLQPKGLVSLFVRGMIYETTSLIDDGVTVRPVDYASTDTIADPVRTTRYFFYDERVAGIYKGRQRDLPMLVGGHNRISVHVALMLALQRGIAINGFPIFDRARWKEYRFEVIPDQVVKTRQENSIQLRCATRHPTTTRVHPSISRRPCLTCRS